MEKTDAAAERREKIRPAMAKTRVEMESKNDTGNSLSLNLDASVNTGDRHKYPATAIIGRQASASQTLAVSAVKRAGRLLLDGLL